MTNAQLNGVAVRVPLSKAAGSRLAVIETLSLRELTLLTARIGATVQLQPRQLRVVLGSIVFTEPSDEK